MARNRGVRESTISSLYREPTPTARNQALHAPVPDGTISPAGSFSSDKENRGGGEAAMSKRKRNALTASKPGQAAATTAKRRRLSEKGEHGTDDATDISMPPPNRPLNREEPTAFYNPDQDQKQRSVTRSKLRDQTRRLQDERDTLVNNVGGLVPHLRKQDQVFTQEVRQTGDATMDSRYMVDAAHIALKATTVMLTGDTSTGIDLDEFISKCITFMRYGPDHGDEAPRTTQTQRRRRNRLDEEEEMDAQGDALNWHTLGKAACIPFNRRPPLPSFLLGPLSVQKRVRAPTQRTVRLQRETQGVATKPQELQAEDLERNEASNISNVCADIRARLQRHIYKGSEVLAAFMNEVGEEDEEAVRAKFKEVRLSSNWEVSLFDFAVHPASFGQTVENLFYISFLVRDGWVKLSQDEDGLPTIRFEEPKPQEERRKDGAARHQAIFSIDYGIWRDLINAFDLEGKQPLIPHRQEQQTQVSARGWYG